MEEGHLEDHQLAVFRMSCRLGVGLKAGLWSIRSLACSRIRREMLLVLVGMEPEQVDKVLDSRRHGHFRGMPAGILHRRRSLVLAGIEVDTAELAGIPNQQTGMPAGSHLDRHRLPAGNHLVVADSPVGSVGSVGSVADNRRRIAGCTGFQGTSC